MRTFFQQQSLIILAFCLLTCRLTAQQTNEPSPEVISWLSAFHGGNSAWAYDAQSKKFAVKSKDGSLKTAYTFDRPQRFQNGVALVVINGKYRIVDSTGQTGAKEFPFLHYAIEKRLIQPQFSDERHYYGGGDFINYGGDLMYKAKNNNDATYTISTVDKKVGALNNFGELIVPPLYEHVYTSGNNRNFFEAKSGRNITFYDKRSKKVVESMPLEMPDCKECNFYDPVKNTTGRVRNGRIIIPADYNLIGEIEELFMVYGPEGRAIGVIDSIGNFLISPGQNNIIRFNYSSKVFEVRNDSYSENQVISKTGEVYFSSEKYLPVTLNRNRFIVSENLKYGIVDQDDQVIVPLQYDQLYTDHLGLFKNNCVEVGTKNKTGIMDYDGKLLVPIEQDGINCPFQANGIAFLQKNKKWALFNLKTQKSTGYIYDGIYTTETPVFLIKMADKENLITPEGKVLLDANSKEVEYAGPGLFWVKGMDGKWELFNLKGEKITSTSFNDVREFKDGKAWVLPTDMSVTPSEKKETKEDVEEILVVKTDGSQEEFLQTSGMNKQHWVLIDTLGNIDRSIYFDGIGSFQGYQAIASLNGSLGYVRQNGSVIIPPQFIQLDEPYRKFVSVKNESGFGIFHAGRLILPCEFETIGTVYEGHVFAQKSGNWICYDTTGSPVSQKRPQYLSKIKKLPKSIEEYGAEPESNGWIRIKQNGKWGWWDPVAATLAIDCLYDVATPFKNGMSRVRQAPFQGEFWINTNGDLIFNLPPSSKALYE